MTTNLSFRTQQSLSQLLHRHFKTKKYQSIKRKVNNTKKERKKYIEKFIAPVSKEFKKNNINATIFGRAKHYSSIIGKMEKRNKKFEEIYDLFAIRIIVDKLPDCYATLGVIHQLYNPFQERFKDFIATPKSNGYQSIHTTVIGPNGNMVEIQIHTRKMDKTAEIGVAAHWRYKEGNNRTTILGGNVK